MYRFDCRTVYNEVLWEFHCCLSPDHCYCHITPVPEDSLIIILCTLHKDISYYNIGPSALPLRVIEDDELTPFHSPSQSKSYMETTRLHEAMFTSSQDVELKRQSVYTKITDPFFCLRETIADLWKNVYRRPGVRSSVLLSQKFYYYIRYVSEVMLRS